MEEALKKKVRKRSGHRLFVKNILSTYKDHLPKDGAELSDSSRVKLESYRGTLRKQETELRTLDNEICDLLPEDAIEKEVKESLDLEGIIDETLYVIGAVLGTDNDLRNTTEKEATNSSIASGNSVTPFRWKS
eukprot:Seg8311.1 transcript_id=Seg8311.1/GoldUCD/mRNA.D3Y31 product="hypothetical protein" protein_id=Seg8311.1/GoldUCD/D3Y31